MTFGRSVCVLSAVLGSLLCAPAARAATWTVNAGGDLQAAINAAQPGDTILVQADAIFTGTYTLPAKFGSAFITIRSSAPDSALPGAGMRMTPAYASLLPDFQPARGAAFRTAPHASYWRLQFLEIFPGAAGQSADLVQFGSGGSSQNVLSAVPHDLVIDRSYLHGDPGFGQRRGVALNSRDSQVINSYFADFKSTSVDSQAICGWNGPGPFLIENNYLEASGENVMFGGADPSIPNLVPGGITLRRNHLAKPQAWMRQAWRVKNLIELKNAADVVIEGNLLERSWRADQQGYAIMLAPTNQNRTAPWTQVRNVAIRHNVIRHVAAAINITGYDSLAPSQQTQAITVTNNLFYDVSSRWTNSASPAIGRAIYIGGGPRDVTISRNTMVSTGSGVFIGGGYSPTGVQIAGLVFNDNIVNAQKQPVYGNAQGEGSRGLAHYAPSAQFAGNVIRKYSESPYPAGTIVLPPGTLDAQFVNAAADDYRLAPSSIIPPTSGVDASALGSIGEQPSGPPPGPTTPVPGSDARMLWRIRRHVGVWRGPHGTWYVKDSASSSSKFRAVHWGSPGLGDRPVAGDYDGDGYGDLAVWRPGTGVWHILTSQSNYVSALAVEWGSGALNDQPVPADYDGDGRTDLAVWRPGSGVWFVLTSRSGFTESITREWGAGHAGDVPVPGDYDCDGRADFAVWRTGPGLWFALQSSTGYQSFIMRAWGTSEVGDQPVPADYDGDGRTDMAVWRSGSGVWYVLGSARDFSASFSAAWGGARYGDHPVPGDYDGDGTDDIAVWRAGSGTWHVLKSSSNYRQSSSVQWGQAGDVPVTVR